MSFVQTLRGTAVQAARWVLLERPPRRANARSSTYRHLALLAWALPPHSGAGVHRPLSFMRYGCRRGWRIDAFGTEPSHDNRKHGEQLLSRVPPEARLHTVPPSSHPSHRLFPRVDGGFTNALEYAHAAISALVDDPPDVVLASGPPFCTFVAALFVARRFGVPLVLDYRDEWTECPFDFVTTDGDDVAWERRCLRNADAVLFTTESHLRHQLLTFPELDPRKAHLVPNGWEPDDFVTVDGGVGSTTRDESKMLRVAHVGTLSGHTPPNEFLRSLHGLLTNASGWMPDIKVQFIGRRSPAADESLRSFGLDGVIETIDHIGKREANRRMQESDILLLIATPDLARYLPGKMFDYIAARRPVLVFGAAGEASTIVEQLGAGVLCPPGSIEALRDALLNLSKLDLTRHAHTTGCWLKEHTRDVLAGRAFDIIEAVSRSE